MQTKACSKSSDDNMQKEHDESLYNYLEVILKHRKVFSYIVGTVFVLSIIISLILPKMYRATAGVLAPRESGGGVSTLLANNDDMLGSLAVDLIGGYGPVAQYIGILKSRTVADEISRKFDLKKLYGFDYSEDVNKELARRSTIEFSKQDQIISISVEDRDPKRAAEMANAYVDMLDKINRKLSTTQGRRKRIFLEERLKEVSGDLEQAEIALKLFQEKYHLVAIEEQAKTAIEGSAKIKGEILAAKTELEVFKQFGTEKQVEALMLKAKIEELEKQLESIESGSNPEPQVGSEEGIKPSSSYYIPFKKMPELGMQLMRLKRETKIQEKLFELLTAQYEKARIEEAKDVDTIQILDSAEPPERKSSPKRVNIVIASTILSIFVGIFYAFFREFITDKFYIR